MQARRGDRMPGVALVTGAGSGVGRASALALQRAGFAVVLAGRRLEQLEKTAALGLASEAAMVPVATDVSSPESVDALFGRIRDEFGRLDVLFNNAGMSAPGRPMDVLTFEQWPAVVN